MYAVIKTGGKQYRVAPNDVLRIERLDAAAGRRIAFNEVLAVDAGQGLTVGAPRVSGAMVTATVLEQTHAPTVIVFKKKRRHNYRRKNGHRQDLTVVRIGEILTDGRQPSPEPEAEAAAPAPRGARKAKPKSPAATEAKKTDKPKPAAAKAKPATKAGTKSKAADSAKAAKKPARKAPARKPRVKE